MMECAHKTIGRFSCHTQKSTAIEKTSWMMHHALQVVCGLKGKVMNEQEWKEMVGVMLSSLMVKKALDEKHKAQAVISTQRQCHSSNIKHGQCVFVAHALKNTLAIISDVVA